jgi:hypothetical protein
MGNSPDTDTVINMLKDLRDRVELALAKLEGKPVERLVYRAALDEIVRLDEGISFDIAHEAIMPYTPWKAVNEDLGFDSPADRRAQEERSVDGMEVWRCDRNAGCIDTAACWKARHCTNGGRVRTIPGQGIVYSHKNSEGV